MTRLPIVLVYFKPIIIIHSYHLDTYIIYVQIFISNLMSCIQLFKTIPSGEEVRQMSGQMSEVN